MDATRLKSYEEFLEFMKHQQLPHAVDAVNRIVELPCKGAPLPGNLYIKWHQTVPFLQLVHFMVEGVPDARVGALETALIRLNNVYEVPGFGYDHRSHRLYYRLVVPVLPDDGISVTTLIAMGSGCVKAAKEFLEGFKAVLDGQPGEDIETIVANIARARKAASTL